MSRRGYVVRFGSSPTIEMVSRIRDFAEDLFVALRDDALGSVPDMDTAINEVHVDVPSSRNLGRVGNESRRLLRRHNFPGAVVSKRKRDDR